MGKRTLIGILVVFFAVCSSVFGAYGGGSGIEGAPYLIYDANQLNAIGANSLDWNKHFKLMADIDLIGYNGTSFNIIGTEMKPFRGIFDGNGYKIENFTYTETSSDFVGLFRYIDGAQIRNVGIVDPNILCVGNEHTGNVGALVGRMETGTIDGCYVQGGTVRGTRWFIGGLVGWMWSGSITNCCSFGTQVIGGYNVGGVIGNHGKWYDDPPVASLTNCVSTAYVGGDGWGFGGIVGFISDNGIITDCFSASIVGGFLGGTIVGGLIGSNHGIVSDCQSISICDSENGGRVSGFAGSNIGTIFNCASGGSVLSGWVWVGGLVGENLGLIDRSWSTCDVTGNHRVGGLVGEIYSGSVTECYATGDVSDSGVVGCCSSEATGGLVGTNFGGLISNCYATGNVYGSKRSGGLVGWNTDDISNCYSVGTVSGITENGGLVGANIGGSISNSFWDTQTSEQATSAGGTGKTTDEMQMESTFTDYGWDFNTPIWSIDDGNNYPFLPNTGVEIKRSFLFVSPDFIQFIALEGDTSSQSKTLFVANCGEHMNWEIHEDCPWLEVSTVSGETTTEVSRVMLSLNSSALSKGNYECQLSVSDPCDLGIQRIVAVTITILGVYYVDGDANGANDGTSWEDAFNHLQDALSAVSCGEEIWVAEGIYEPDANSSSPDGSGDRQATFQLKNGVTIKGGYAGVGAPDPNERNVRLYETILCGDLDGNDVDVDNLCDLLTEPTRGENSYHVVTGSGTDGTAIIDGFTITAGNANGGGGCPDCHDHGAGMFNWHNASPTVTNCTFSGNSGKFGVGMFNGLYSSPGVTNCTFSGNACKSGGGGMANDSGSAPTLTNCIFSGNSAGSWGGGMANWRLCDPNVINCTFAENEAGSYGGGINNDNRCRPTLSNCIVWGNSAPACPQICDERRSLTTANYSDIRGGWPGNGNIDADPLFVDPNSGDYHLLPGSPCIDAGDNNSVSHDTHDLDGDGNTAEPIPFDLDGNARIVDGNNDGTSVVDMGAYEFSMPPIEVAMKFTPQALNPGSKGNWVKVHFVLPEEYTVSDVDVNSPAKITEPFEPDIDSNYVDVFINDDNLVEVEAAFERAVFCEADISDETIEVTATGAFTSGQQFYGTDTIKIVTNSLKYVASLASRWLETTCGKPDWCIGLDLDQDSIVNFRDFALFDGCCIEVVRE
jgi:hypothetical protein